MLCPYVALLTLVLCACSINGQANDMIFFDFVPENIYEGQSNNNITLRRFGTTVGDITINYTVSGIGITSPDDFTGGDFSIVYPPNEDPLKVPITFNDNSFKPSNDNPANLHVFEVCDTSRTIVVTITGIDNGPVPESNLKHFIVVDDDGEWTAWDTTEGPCNCTTGMRDRSRNRTCDNKGIPGRTCDGPATIDDTVSCAGDPACTVCYSAWGCWKPGPCSVSCGPGSLVETRNRELLDCGNDACDQPLEQNRTAACMEQNCMCAEALTGWSEWVASGSCSATCDGMLLETRNRTCKMVSGCSGVPLDQTRTEVCSSPC